MMSEQSGYVRYVFLVGGIVALIIIALFLGAQHVPPDSLEQLGTKLPLPLFTFVIAIIDGFNPCNLFVLTLLLGFLVSASKSRFRIYITGYTFVFVVAVFYFLFMAAWLNVFRYIGFVPALRIGIAIIAIIAGLINCKELFFYKKGVSLTIQDRHKGPLYRKARHMQEVITEGAIPALIVASAALGIFSSLVELPCTAGFPIIYTGILAGRYLDTSLSYYAYLALYNAVYVLPLVVVIGIFGFVLKAGKITPRHVQVIKFIGGLIMILLGIVLLVNPGLVMVQ
jgi:cytochrome c biogenesis protein CcdA